MPPPIRTSFGRVSLSSQLDKDIYPIIVKIADDEGNIPRTSAIYQRIRNSNSSLSRRPKKILEDSIQRVVSVIQADQADDDSPIDDETIPEEAGLVTSNALNRSITESWSKPAPPTTTNGTDITNGHHDPQETISSSSVTTTKSKKRSASEAPLRKRSRLISHSPSSDIRLADLGGVHHVVEQLQRLLARPLLSLASYTNSAFSPPRGVLLHGPPGCGKTTIAEAFAAELKIPFISISAPSVVSGMSGESEKALREHFDEAKRIAPCIMFIDEIDAITPKREGAQREMEKRIVAQLLICMDGLALHKTGGKLVVVIGATNRPDSLDPALRRGGRFDAEIIMNAPTQPMRKSILRALTQKMNLADDIDFEKLAQQTPGFVGADLQSLVSTAGSFAFDREDIALEDEARKTGIDLDNAEWPSELKDFHRMVTITRLRGTNPPATRITNDDFLKALPTVLPSLKREGFTTVPDTTWADIGALESIRKKLQATIVDPILNPKKYARVGITTPSGVLLWGPPGCGKTLLAKAVANESKANFISIKGPELLNKYVGESERAVRQVFSRARACAPCVVFFDELDALAPHRDDSLSGSSARVVNMLLTELDGLDKRVGVYVLAATNRPDIIDPAMTRPGRLEALVKVDLPQKHERVEILRTLLRDINLTFDATLQRVAEECEGFSGADLSALVRQAGLHAIERDDDLRIDDFIRAQESVKPSVADVTKYRLNRSL